MVGNAGAAAGVDGPRLAIRIRALCADADEALMVRSASR